MGLMGRLTERDRQLIAKAVEGIAANDIDIVEEAVRQLGKFRTEPDKKQLRSDLKTFLDKYGTTDMGQLDVVKVIQDMMAIMKKNKISMPPGLSLLVRGLTHMEGVLAEISPEINIVQIAAGRIHSEFFRRKILRKYCTMMARGCTSLFTRRSIYRDCLQICCGIIPKENPEFIWICIYQRIFQSCWQG